MTENARGRIPAVFIPVLLFIVFDAVALGLNFWISARLEENAVAINLSGRQRMLSQRMTKALLMLHVAQTDTEKLSAFTEFSNAVGLFDKTLSGFLQGGITSSGDGKPVYLSATEAVNTQVITGSASLLWTLIHKRLLPVEMGGAQVGAEVLLPALNTLLTHNTQLLGLMNDLTTALELNATKEVIYLRTLQASLLLLALLNFALVCKRLLAQIKQSQGNVQALRNIIDSIETGIVLYGRDECVRSANKTANQLFGYSDQALIGKPLNQLIVADNARILGLRRDNSTFVAKINIQTLFEFNDQISLCTITDVSEQERKEKQLMYLAFHDQLTGLPNRGLLIERLRQDLLRAKRDSTFLAVFFLDLDGFKVVNDEMGHDAGDELLQAVARRFEQCCREVDTVARLGGDEFVFVLTSLHSVLAAKQVAQNVLKAINQAFLIHGKTVKIGASIGIAMYPTDHSEAELLIKCADDAMYLAKQRGKNQLAFTVECR
ncbi:MULTISPECIES: diguanylate cyclase domain-containing protein [Methylomonas]|uniref:Diguanylate cyclase n=2 Tax=Methylomonas TaxID=416 RepID=A0A126T7D1_9GAMM|nr:MULTISPECIES: diguanylate cyclase [Methylomonas]AMK77940.1 diguanylate cyclase [Methylomonas denitrificans]OAI07754.1 diguanylate cyclase [Methylomonas methanica]TCV85473.1 PAS domain S-box-containing protein/diguanylate cyclase (GGDEF)-like protein [Methylomonas methanica]